MPDPCPSCCDAAALRRAFTEASNYYGRVREARTAKLPRNQQPSPDDVAEMAAWVKLYASCRSHRSVASASTG